ncbi:MAG: pyridoxal phosphate-dependent aminotransferase, partial [Candidatus Heimdallarchaeota archaeon]|nr:pyridoxal phosphate-dependent aminotransferase [Candidatus Heimdallarchaeota archaeon]MCK4876667.1 pyridoxal phosphate-dependent aminotransferase [Candidatus Heimdallarchaeota archaeon]
MTHLADRLEYFQESVIREMTRKALENDSINLSQGMPDFSPPKELTQGISETLEEDEHQYTVTYGNFDLREKISEKLSSYNHITADPEDEITITCGASEAIASSILALTNPGDEVLILEPWYENYVPITLLAQGKPVFVGLSSDSFSLNEESFKEKISDKTKLIILNTPHNPTGKVFTSSEQNIISDLCQDHDLIALTDEIYEYIIFDEEKHISLGSINGMRDRTITVSGFSKTFSITGWRLGYVSAEKELMSGVRKVHDYLTVCAPSLLQKAVMQSFQLQQSYFEELKERYSSNRNFLLKELKELGFNSFKPSGAYYLFADISFFGLKDTEFADFLVKDKGVATVPGTSFYQKQEDLPNQGEHYVRFSFSQRMDTLQEAIKRIKERI